MTIDQYKRDFETWYFAQFGNGIGLNYDDDGYESEIINAMWIGFCAGRITA